MFNQKYLPTRFGELVFQNDIVRAKLENYASGKRKGNFLLYGPYGTGKSTAARIIAETSPKNKEALFTEDVDAINCSRFKQDSAKLVTFAMIERSWQFSGQKYPYAVLDEFDLLSKAQQDSV